MYSEERGIFKPSLKTHVLTNDVSIKRFSFSEHYQREDNNRVHMTEEMTKYEPLSYPSLDDHIEASPKNFITFSTKESENLNKHSSLINENESNQTATKFDPILPKILFKRFISNEDEPNTQSKKQNLQIIQELKVKNINYPIQVEKLFKESEEKKTQYFSSFEENSNPHENETNEAQWRLNSYRNSINSHLSSGLRKMPYFPLIGTDGKIFWSYTADKVVLWKYRNSEIHNPEVFCILKFEKESAPITAIYATQVISPLFKNQKIILIAIAFFNQLQFYSFNIEKFETEFLKTYDENEKNENYFQKYVEKILVKVNSNFFIEKILIQNIQSFEGLNHESYPIVLFTDGSRDLEIVDLSNLAAFKSHNQYDPFLKSQKIKENKNQNEIIKLLHCRDEIRPEIHYAFVLRKETVESEVKPKSLIEKIKNFFTFNKKFEKNEQMILSIYEWNEKELKNETLWKKIWNPPRIKKIKELSSKDLENRLKQNFFEFFRLNSNSQFFIADISLVEKPKNYSIFENQQKSSCFLKLTFINGTYVTISNFRALTFASKAMVNPYMENSVPIICCQYKNYRNILEKGHYLQTQQEIKNKFNLYIYESIDFEKEAKYSSIDPVISESNGLMICEDKLMYQDDEQITYKFHESNERKRINEVNLQKFGQKKSFMIFENSFITLVETPNMAENLLVLGYLLARHPQGKDKISNYVNLLLEDMPENNRISFLKSIIELLILIINSGKKTQSLSSNRMILEDILKDFYGKEKRLDIDDTTYVEEKDHEKHATEEVYLYDYEICKESYENFVEYLLGNEVASKEREFLKERNISYNGKSFQLKITENTVNFLMDILIQQSLVVIPTKNSLKPLKTTSVGLFNVGFSANEKIYLQNLVEGMEEVQESYLAGAISKFIVDLIRPLLNLPYEGFHNIKPTNTRILEILDFFKQFIEKLVRYSSFKNEKSAEFTETVLLMKSLQNSLPKFSLLLRLFDSLSEIHYYNAVSLNKNGNHHLNKNGKNNQNKTCQNSLTLLNFLFKLDLKEKLSQMAVEMLFEENSGLLDEIESKLPELNEVKYLRFFKGWRNINAMILEGNATNKSINNKADSTWIFSFFNKKNKSSKFISPNHPEENEERNLEEKIMRQKEEFTQIEKALNEYSYEDFEKFFINKTQFVNFTFIVLSKIHYLQSNYLQLKSKYQFQDGSYDTPQSFASNLIEKPLHSISSNFQINKLPIKTLKKEMSALLKYEEKIHNHQKYLKTYELIKFLNSKLSFFIDKVLQIYTEELQKSAKEIFSTPNTNNIKAPIVNQPNHYSKKPDSYLLGQEVQNLVDLIMEKGSEFIKKYLESKLKLSPLFENNLLKHKTYLKEISTKSEQFNEFLDGKYYLVKDQEKSLTKEEKEQMIFDNERKNMYLQKIEEKKIMESRGSEGFSYNTNWMKSHNKNSSLNFSNYQF